MSERSETQRPARIADGWLVSRWRRLNPPTRIAGVDLARGLAVLGMFAAHLVWITDPFDWSSPETWIAVAQGRSSILFATLAGVSLGLLTAARRSPGGAHGAVPRPEPGVRPLAARQLSIARRRLAVRAAMLWIIGVLLIATGVPVYVILPAYAVLFLLAIPLTALPARVLLSLAGALALVTPFIQVVLDALPFWPSPEGSIVALAVGWHYPFTTWIAFVVAGLGLARAGVTRLPVQLWMIASGAVLAVAGYGVDAATGAPPELKGGSFAGALWTARPHSTGLLEVIGSGGFAIAVLGMCLLLCRTAVVWIVLPLRAVGAMPLTAYTMQLVVWALVAADRLGDTSDLSGFRALEPFWPVTIATVVCCTAWALLIGRGPLETLLDRVSRWVVRGTSDAHWSR